MTKAFEIGQMTIRCYPTVNNTDIFRDIALKEYLEACITDSHVTHVCESLRKQQIENPINYKELETWKLTKAYNRCATISGISEQGRKDKLVTRRNPLIVIDIDYDDNQFLQKDGVIDRLVEKLFYLPCVYAAGKSCSGKGVYAIIYIGHNDDDKDFHDAFRALDEDFTAAGINLDKKCKNISRLRFASSYMPLIKPDYIQVEPYLNRKEQKHFEIPVTVSNTSNYLGINDEDLLEEVINMILDKGWQVNGYNDWIHCGALLHAYGGKGLELFDRISRYSPGYVGTSEVYKKWKDIESLHSTQDECKGYFFGLAKRIIGAGWKQEASARCMKMYIKR